jgi:hypothetical protein
VQFPPMRHNWQNHNFGFWVVGSPAVGVVGLPPYPKHQYDRNYSIIQLWVLGFGSAAVETLLWLSGFIWPEILPPQKRSKRNLTVFLVCQKQDTFRSLFDVCKQMS